MNDDELGRLLSGAFDERARNAVGDDRLPPPPRFATLQAGSEDLSAGQAIVPRRRFATRAALPLSAAAAVLVLVTLVLALVGHGTGKSPRRDARPPAVGATTTPTASSLQGAGAPVHIKLVNSDGSLVGVGMPVIAYFSKKITDARALQDVTTVTVNGARTTAAWYFERSAAMKGYPYEAHLRPRNYWPAHASIRVGMPTDGVTAGKGMRFDDSLTLDFHTGARHVVTVNDTTHRLTFDNAGTHVSYPVSLGAASTPTSRGVKVIMEKGANICMSGPGYSECGIKYTQRLTYDGEYLHSAPWNASNIHAGIDSSNGCTNLLPGEARRLFDVLRIGDVVKYPNANGPTMQLGDGYGDWNVPWKLWLTGGLVTTR